VVPVTLADTFCSQLSVDQQLLDSVNANGDRKLGLVRFTGFLAHRAKPICPGGQGTADSNL
jgi:hypothetical protein